jgi:hypothetical protein
MTASPGLRQLPIFEAGRREGVDIGLRQALDHLTREVAVQEARATRHGPRSTAAARYVYAAKVLADVTKRVAADFRRAAG